MQPVGHSAMAFRTLATSSASLDSSSEQSSGQPHSWPSSRSLATHSDCAETEIVATDNPTCTANTACTACAACAAPGHLLPVCSARMVKIGRFWPYARGILRIPRYSGPKTLAKTKTWPQLDRYDYGHEHYRIRASQHSRPRSNLPNRGPSRRRMRPHLHRTRQRNHHGPHEMGRV